MKTYRITIARIMREEGVLGRRPRRFVPKTTDSTHDHPITANNPDRQFEAGTGIPVWVRDITYVPTREGCIWRR